MPDSENSSALVVGSGLAGLTCGILLQEAGREVTLVEQHMYFGGCLQGFQRRGVWFDTGFHYVGASRPGEVFARYLKLLGVYDDLEIIPPNRGCNVRVTLSSGRVLDLPVGFTEFFDFACGVFPAQAGGLREFERRIADMVRATPWLGLVRDEPDVEAFDRGMTTTSGSVIRGCVNDPELIELLDSFAFDTTLLPHECPFAFYSFVFYTLSLSCNRIRGGGPMLIRRMVERFTSLGGRILSRVEPVAVHVESKAVRSVELSNGETVEPGLVVSTCHPAETVRFVGREHFSPGFIETLDGLEQSLGAFKIYLELTEDVPSIGADHCLISDPAYVPGVYLMSPSAMEGGLDVKPSLEILIWQDYAEVERWADTRRHRRGDEYEAAKLALAERILDRVEREYPGVRPRIRHMYTSSSLTARDYTRTVNGATMGIRQDVAQQGRNHVRPRNRVRNLWLAGQSVGTPGVIGTVIFAVKLCDSLLPGAGLLDRIRRIDFGPSRSDIRPSLRGTA